jgi:hypothetical protein
MRFVYMLVKTHENFLRGRSAGFKALCQELKVDALFPLLLLTGVFELRVPGFRVATYVYEEWLNSLLQLRMPDTMQGPAPSTYCLDTLLTIEMQGGNASQWYEKALLKIRQLTDIRDSQAVENIVLELLRL